jgi:hypothetical protein
VSTADDRRDFIVTVYEKLGSARFSCHRETGRAIDIKTTVHSIHGKYCDEGIDAFAGSTVVRSEPKETMNNGE